MNELGKAFVERMTRLKISPGPNFAALTKQALEGEWGGEGDALLAGLSRETLESPKRLASELFRSYGEGAMNYLAIIAKFAESGNFHPEEDQELAREEEELESVIQETGSEPGEEP